MTDNSTGQDEIDNFFTAMDSIRHVQTQLGRLSAIMGEAGNTKISEDMQLFEDYLRHAHTKAQHAFMAQIK